MRRVLAGFAAAIMAIVGGAVSGGQPSVAGPCERVVYVNPEITVNEGANRLIFSVFSGGCGVSGEVAYAATAGTAKSPMDYSLANGRIKWPAGDTYVRTIVVSIVDDGVDESNLEGFTVTLTSISKGTKVAVPSAHGRIADNDGLGLVWTVDDQICPDIRINTAPPPGTPWLTGEQKYLCDFGDGVINALPTGPHGGPGSVTWGTVDGTAHSGADFVGVTNQIAYVPPNAPYVELRVTMLTRLPGMGSEWFYVRVSGVSSGAIADGTAIVTIGVV